MPEPITIRLPTLHAGQVRAFRTPGRFKAIRCGRRWGKALALDTPIPTPSGWTTMGEIKSGDLVFDETGSICRVVGTSDVMTGHDCREVVFSDGTSIVADDGHLWLTWTHHARKNMARFRGVREPSNMWAKVRTTAEIASTITSPGGTNHSIKCCEPLEGPAINFTIPPYVLGAWLGDGLSAGGSIACNDPQIIEEIRGEGQPSHKLTQKYMWRLGRKKSDYVAGEVSLQVRLRNLGLLHNKHVPLEYLRASSSQRLALLQGLMDTDGYVSARGHCEFTSMLEGLANSVLELARSFGIHAVICIGRATLYGKDCGTKYRVKFSTHVPVFRLKRKLDRLLSAKRRRNINHRFIVSADRIESVPVKCIAVDSPSRLYLAGDAFIPTHNTKMLSTIASNDAAKGLLFGFFAPDYKRLSETFRECHEILAPIVSRSSQNDGIIRTSTGGQIEFWTLEDDSAGRSRKYHRVAIDEAAFTKPNMSDIWERAIKPTLFDYSGRALVTSNTNGIDETNFFWRICNISTYGFTQYHAPTSDNPIIPMRMPGESLEVWQARRAEELAALVRDNPPLVYAQEFGANFVDFGGASFFSRDKLLVNNQPVAEPSLTDVVFATIDTAVKDGKDHDSTAVIYWGKSAHVGHPLVILDWDVIQIEGALLETWLPTVFQNLDAFTANMRVRLGNAGAFIEDKQSGSILLQQAKRRGWPAREIESRLTDLGKDGRAISVSGYVHREMVKITQSAFDKTVTLKGVTRNHLLSQLANFRVGDKDAGKRADDLADCFTYGVAIALGNNEGF